MKSNKISEAIISLQQVLAEFTNHEISITINIKHHDVIKEQDRLMAEVNALRGKDEI